VDIVTRLSLLEEAVKETRLAIANKQMYEEMARSAPKVAVANAGTAKAIEQGGPVRVQKPQAEQFADAAGAMEELALKNFGKVMGHYTRCALALQKKLPMPAPTPKEG
jgi:hypothetical protein